MRISDLSSDLCSSDLLLRLARPARQGPGHLLRNLADPQRLDRRAGDFLPARIQLADDRPAGDPRGDAGPLPGRRALRAVPLPAARGAAFGPVLDRQSVVYDKSVSVRVVLGGRRKIKKK